MDSGLITSPTPPSRPGTSPIRAWLLLSKYGGDNAQVLALGAHLREQLGWRCDDKQVRFYPADKRVREKLPEAINFGRSDSLEPPFPDVIVSCSRFYGMLGAWLKAQSSRPIVHVHLGRIAAPMSSFDLIAATAQYGLPAAANFVPLTLPFVPQDAVRRAAAVAHWAPQIQHLPKPWTVLMVGGPVPLVRFDEAAAERIADQAIAGTRAIGGSLILIVSRRTPGPVRRRIAARIAAAGLPGWSVDWPSPEPNPYPALLALGDRFIVTFDSASMIADACMTGKPLELVRLPILRCVTRLSSRGLGFSIDARRRRRGREGLPRDVRDRLRDFLVAEYWMRPWDEIRDFLHALDSRGLLAADPGDRARQIQSAELDAVATRIARLVEAKRAAPPRPIDAAALPEPA